jgi:uncharacterized lipoprotein
MEQYQHMNKKMINHKIKVLAVTSLLVLLSACANKPSHVVISPDLTIANSTVNKANYQSKQASITISDMRSAQHVVQIIRKDEAAEVYSSQAPLAQVIERTLTSELKNQGLTVKTQANNKIEIIIDKALVSVQQEMIKYQVNNELVIRVKVNNSVQTLSKKFQVRGTSEGPLSGDIAVLERDFNQQLAQLLAKIINNTEIQSFIK